MRYLLDTHIFIWWMEDDRRLSKDVMSLVNDPRSEVFLSIAIIWEMVIKSSKGKLRIPKDIEKVVKTSQFIILPIEIPHVLETGKLPHHHEDPFDRILVSQAKKEGLTLITHDRKIWKYKIPLIKV